MPFPDHDDSLDKKNPEDKAKRLHELDEADLKILKSTSIIKTNKKQFEEYNFYIWQGDKTNLSTDKRIHTLSEFLRIKDGVIKKSSASGYTIVEPIIVAATDKSVKAQSIELTGNDVIVDYMLLESLVNVAINPRAYIPVGYVL